MCVCYCFAGFFFVVVVFVCLLFLFVCCFVGFFFVFFPLLYDHIVLQVGDFGLSRELANTDYYVSRGGVVPVRWTAPEAIFYRKYSSASDVWSYGCLLYEIWTMGVRPYEGIPTNKVCLFTSVYLQTMTPIL